MLHELYLFKVQLTIGINSSLSFSPFSLANGKPYLLDNRTSSL